MGKVLCPISKRQFANRDLRLPDTGYIAMQEMCDKIQEAVRQVKVPVMADGDTGYGSPMNVRRTVECYAHAGAAGVMIEDQTWPKSESALRIL